MRHVPAILVAVGVAAALAGCQSTQDRSAEIGRTATRLAREQGLRIARPNADVSVAAKAVLQDENGIAAVVELRNTGRSEQASVPVEVVVRDARGRSIYANTAPGLDASLISMSVLERGRTVAWVNDQVVANGRAARLDVRVGAARRAAPATVPHIAVERLTPGSDSDGPYVKGVVRNDSKVVQTRLTVYCVARLGGRIVAAGRATVERLAAKPQAFTIFFIGDPAGARLEAAAPATVLR